MTIRLDLDPEAVRDAVADAATDMIINKVVDGVVIHKNGGATVTFATIESIDAYMGGDQLEGEVTLTVKEAEMKAKAKAAAKGKE
jgi:hypothetical protein